jgi:hypothetical protein
MSLVIESTVARTRDFAGLASGGGAITLAR